jgi:NAD+ synthase
VCETLAESGAEMLLSINGSPYEDGKTGTRLSLAVARVVETGLPFVFCAQVCGQDELVFDGASFVLNPDRSLAVVMPSFEEAITLTEWRRDAEGRLICASQPLPPEPDHLESIYRCLMLGLGDYVRKNGFAEIVVGVSGGIDSALVAALAAEALGPHQVHCISMPSRYSSEGTRTDAQRLAENLDAGFREIAIEPIVERFLETLAPFFAGREPDLAEENLQARIRGTLLMALSNKFGWLLLATGNKSELSVGYATLYGDMAGGFALLKDVYKTDVFRLARHLNERAGRELIPQTIIERAPSAELRADQLDEDSLPPYPKLDAVLEAYVEQDRTLEELSGDGFDPDVVTRAVALVDRSEYKRRQAPPGVRLRQKAFGRDRRTPITNRWRS